MKIGAIKWNKIIVFYKTINVWNNHELPFEYKRTKTYINENRMKNRNELLNKTASLMQKWINKWIYHIISFKILCARTYTQKY